MQYTVEKKSTGAGHQASSTSTEANMGNFLNKILSLKFRTEGNSEIQ